MTTALHSLLHRVASRHQLVVVARRTGAMFLVLCSCALLTILSARLLNVFPLPQPGALFCGAALVLLIVPGCLVRRPSAPHAARLTDSSAGTKDLFLNALLAQNAGGFSAIVVGQAEERASSVNAAQVVPFHWQRGMARAALAAGVIVAAFFGTPQLDPLKRQAARDRATQTERRLIETKRETEVRREELRQAEDREATDVKDALARLEKTFQQARPNEPQTALKELALQQKDLGELWRKLNDSDLRKNLEQTAQSFGQADPKQLEAWRKELQKGDASGVKAALSKLREAARQAAQKPDSAARRAEQQQVAQQLRELAQSLKQMTGSAQVNASMQRALEQLDIAKLEALGNDAQQGAIDSMKLSEEELEQLAQSLKDSRNLEDALKSLQMARQLADAGKLDGSECKGGGLSAYAELFESKMGERGQQAPLSREARLGEGAGNGALRPEDDSVKTGFKSERGGGQLSGGKMLLEWKTQEVGETGARTEQYQAAVRSVQQGVAEAIQQEQVPPGYHEAIKRYFDSLPQK